MHHDIDLNTDLTGNDYVCIPFIYPDCGLDGVNVLHGGTGSLIEWMGDGAESPLVRISFSIDGHAADCREARWRRLDRWIPTFTHTLADGTIITGVVCAPGGYPAARGCFMRIEVENRGRKPIEVVARTEFHWRWSRQRIASARPLGVTNRMSVDPHGTALLLETDAGSGPALAITTSHTARLLDGTGAVLGATSVVEAANGMPIDAVLIETFPVTPQRRGSCTVFIGAGRERDGALQAAYAMKRSGADSLVRQARLELSHTLRPAQDHRWAETLNRNLVFSRYYACGRAIDDDRLYLLRSRSPLCSAPVLFNEREALFWTIPALIIADPGLAREALLRVFETYSERSGEYRRYIDGGAFDPAFALDQFLMYPWAIDRYVRDTSDDTILHEPLVRQVLHETDGAAYMRLHPQHLLAATDVLPSGDNADYPYATIANVLLWWLSNRMPQLVLREENEPAARFEGAAGEIAAAVWQHCVTDVDGTQLLASSADLEGASAIYDDPALSLALLPFFGFCPADDPVWRDTMEFLRSARYPLWRTGAVPGLAERADPQHARLSALCADLLGPDSAAALDRLQKLKTDDGIAAAAYDPATGSTSEPHHAALAGFLAWTLVTAAEPVHDPHAKRKRRR